MKKQIRGHIFAVLTITIWSSTFIVSKIILETLTPLQVLLLRYIIAIVSLSIIYPKFHKPTSWKEELLFVGIGGTLVGYFIFENSALQLTYSTNVSLIVATIPLMTGLLSMIILKTKFLTVRNVLGFVIAYTGVVLIIINGKNLEGVEPIGDILAFGAAIMFAVYSVIMEKSTGTYNLIQRTRKVFIYGLAILVVFFLVSGEDFGGISFNVSITGSLLYLGIVASSLAFIMWNDAISELGPVRTNLYIYMIPVVTTVFAYFILKEKITWLSILGTIAILIGLYLSEHIEDEPVIDDVIKIEDLG